MQLQVQEKLGLSSGKKESKYKNKKTFADNKVFDSGREAERYGELNLLEKAGEISALTLQVTFNLPNGIKYKADFCYYSHKDKEFVVEDAKGCRTKEYKIKKKLMADIGIDIVEV